MQSISHRKTSINAYKLQCNYTSFFTWYLLYIQSSHWAQAIVFVICHYDMVLLHFTLINGALSVS